MAAEATRNKSKPKLIPDEGLPGLSSFLIINSPFQKGNLAIKTFGLKKFSCFCMCGYLQYSSIPFSASSSPNSRPFLKSAHACLKLCLEEFNLANPLRVKASA